MHADNTVVTRDLRGTWNDLPARTIPEVAAVLASSHTSALAALRARIASPGELLIVSSHRVDRQLRHELLADGFGLVEEDGVTHPPRPRSPAVGRVWLLTSGSTGRPSRVAHTIEGLTTVRSQQPIRRWLCAYTPGSYAWWQVVTLTLAQRHQDLVCVEADEVDRWPEIAARESVTAVSGTPTFWRHGLLHGGEDLIRAPLEQITLGGEPVDQGLLDTLRGLFPAARVSWIYASSEAGAAIAVHDGLAGFPLSWLDRDDMERPRLSVDGDELVIASPHAGQGLQGFLRTGDRVEVQNDRVHIVGRLYGDEINVGGSKVAASVVGRVLLEHPAVMWAAVRGRRAPIVGTVIVADVVLVRPVEEAELIAWAAQRLSEYAIPRRLRVLERIPIKETLKSDV